MMGRMGGTLTRVGNVPYAAPTRPLLHTYERLPHISAPPS